MSSLKRKLGIEITDILNSVVLGIVFRFVGEHNFLSVAGTCLRFKQIYQEIFGTSTTLAEELVSTVSGAELFCDEAEAIGDARFRIRKKAVSSFDIIIGVQSSERSTPLLEFVRDTAALNGRLEVLQWAIAEGCILDDFWTPAFAAFNGHLAVLQCLIDNECEWDKTTFSAAALNGHLAVLKWLRRNGCPWDEWTCAYAALNGHMAVLQWLLQHGCPWDAWTCAFAADKGHLAVLKWARANGCPWNEATCSEAARNGHLAVLQWARANECPWDAWTITLAARNGHSNVLQWARANGCPENPDDSE